MNRHLRSGIDILLVCTANQCRSPIAEALLRRRLDQAGVSATVTSAGLRSGGQRATDHSIATVAARGLDLSAHRSRQLDAALIRSADLIICMAREHVREVAVIEPEALARSFTLKELVRASEAVARCHREESLDEWLGRLRAGRRRAGLLGAGYDEAFDVADPTGKRRSDHERTVDELDRLLGRLVAGIRDAAAGGGPRDAALEPVPNAPAGPVASPLQATTPATRAT